MRVSPLRKTAPLAMIRLIGVVVTLCVMISGCCQPLLEDGKITILVDNQTDGSIVVIRSRLHGTEAWSDNHLDGPLGPDEQTALMLIPDVYDLLFTSSDDRSVLHAGLDFSTVAEYVLELVDPEEGT